MKIALITDTHFGKPIKNDSSYLDNNTKRFLENIFFPKIDEMGIDTVIHLGDLVDRKKVVEYTTLNTLKNSFLFELEKRKIKTHVILGNHDIYYKTTNEINALREIIGNNFNYIKYYENPVELEFDNLKVLFLPWICKNNDYDTFSLIKSTSARVVMGHLEINGFEMYKGSIMTHGLERNIFSKFDIVMSGHFHHRSSNGNIVYLGSHGEFYWNDYDDDKGFHIFDTDTRELTFIKNPYTLYEKIWYDDNEEIDVDSIDFSMYYNKIVKVIVSNKNNIYLFDKFIEKLEKSNPYDCKIVEDHLNLTLTSEEDYVDEAESTVSIMKKYVNSLDTKHIKKEDLEKQLIELHSEALNIMV